MNSAKLAAEAESLGDADAAVFFYRRTAGYYCDHLDQAAYGITCLQKVLVASKPAYCQCQFSYGFGVFNLAVELHGTELINRDRLQLAQ